MQKSTRLRLLAGLVFVLAIVAAAIWSTYKSDAKPPPSAGGYYTGPMRGKSNREIWATEDGKIVPPPPGALTAAKGAGARGAGAGQD